MNLSHKFCRTCQIELIDDLFGYAGYSRDLIDVIFGGNTPKDIDPVWVDYRDSWYDQTVETLFWIARESDGCDHPKGITVAS